MKPSNPFAGRSDVSLRRRLERWEVGHFCKRANYWFYETLTALRWSAKASAEAETLALKLMRASAERWNLHANEALAKQKALLSECTMIESGLRGWEPVSETKEQP